jgi:hypothetical protein
VKQADVNPAREDFRGVNAGQIEAEVAEICWRGVMKEREELC